jgi:hypothetical protein
MNEDMTLTDQISRSAAAMAERAPREVIATIGAELGKLAAVLSDVGNQVDRSGVVRLAHVDPDYMMRLEPAAILTALRGITA